MRIEIPENIELFGEGATCFHALCFMQSFLRIASRKLKFLYPNFPIDIIKATEARILSRIITSIDSFTLLCLQGIDYSTCCTIARSIADSLVVIKLIYQENDSSEQSFRHYLYLLDGFLQNAKLLEENIVKTDRITDAEFDALKKQYESARKNFKDGIDFCKSKLCEHPFYTTFPDFSSVAIQQASWKFKRKELNRKGRIESYTWKELYALLDNRSSIISMYSSFFSQFVHGLSISNILGHDDTDNFESLASCVVCLQGIVLQELKRSFNEDNKLLEFFTNEDLKQILMFYSPERISDILKKFEASKTNKEAK
ncbi:MAG: hypothetical protein K2N35_14820 [Muribaculaceae bacterium]|nr:hypothetical protein [Muribaculaceae bacterium]